MKMIFRWHGPKDPISLQYIRQIPGLYGIVSSLYDLPLGEVWPIERIQGLQSAAAAHDLKMEVVDSFRVHEEIKLGRPGREQLMPQYVATLRNLAASGIKVVCYNFMPVFDWTRTQMDYPLPDGSIRCRSKRPGWRRWMCQRAFRCRGGEPVIHRRSCSLCSTNTPRSVRSRCGAIWNILSLISCRSRKNLG